MRLLQLHSDFIEYTPIEKEISIAENIQSKENIRFEEIIVVLVTVEKNDNQETLERSVDLIVKYLDTIKADKILLYPYAHLSSDLAKPEMAFSMIVSLEKLAREKIKEVYRAPFGWTKGFNIKIKGHPLAENLKIVGNDNSKSDDNNDNSEKDEKIQNEKISSALELEKKQKSYWYILEPGGELTPIENFKFQDKSNFKKFIIYETEKNRSVDEQPPHVRIMKKMALADYEPASDSGNMRYYPKGRLMKSLIEQFVTRKIMEYGGVEVETPIMYDSKHPSMESYFNRFPARQYNINSDNKKLFLRFAACFGQFLMAKDFQISYKHLPLKLYELTKYSFRREKSGELVGLRRLRAFSMPDCHAFCRNMDQAKEEALKRLDLSKDVIESFNLSIQDDIEMAIRFTKEFYDTNKEFIHQLVQKINKPVLIEMWNERFFYFVLKWELNFVDNLGKAAALSTDQIDVENGERYEIEYIDEDGNKKFPIILHNSPSGAVERVIYAILEKSEKVLKKGGVPTIPLWLTHTQIRIIPIKDTHLKFCDELNKFFTNEQIRSDIDDRTESVGKKIRYGELEWIPYILVIGDKEVEDLKLTVRDRIRSQQITMTREELVEEIKKQIKNMPYLPLNLPIHLTKRPQIMV